MNAPSLFCQKSFPVKQKFFFPTQVLSHMIISHIILEYNVQNNTTVAANNCYIITCITSIESLKKDIK